MQRQKHESCTDCGRRQVKSSVQVWVLLSIFSISCLFATEIPRLYKKRSEFLNPQLMFRNSYRISDPSLRQEVVDRKWAVKCQSNFFVKSLEWILDVALNPGYTCQDHFPKSKWNTSLSWPVTPEGSWYKPSNSVFIDTIFAKQPRESNQVWERLKKESEDRGPSIYCFM